MVNQEYYNLGTAPSVIRQLFAYGLEQAAKVGADKVYDYSLGNPSIPAPKKVNESIKKIVDEMDSIKLHGYSMAPGFEEARAAVAKDLTARFGLDVKASELFFTCGAAPAEHVRQGRRWSRRLSARPVRAADCWSPGGHAAARAGGRSRSRRRGRSRAARCPWRRRCGAQWHHRCRRPWRDVGCARCRPHPRARQ